MDIDIDSIENNTKSNNSKSNTSSPYDGWNDVDIGCDDKRLDSPINNNNDEDEIEESIAKLSVKPTNTAKSASSTSNNTNISASSTNQNTNSKEAGWDDDFLDF